MKKGDAFNLTFTVSDKIYSGFMDIFNDRNPMHVDDAYAVGKGFGKKVMYGNILNGFISYFIGECLPIKNIVLMSQDIKYIKPVYLNDVLSFHAEIEDIYDSVSMAEFKYIFTNADNVKVAKGTIQIRILS